MMVFCKNRRIPFAVQLKDITWVENTTHSMEMQFKCPICGQQTRIKQTEDAEPGFQEQKEIYA